MRTMLVASFLAGVLTALPAQSADERPILAVLDFTASGLSKAEAQLFSDFLASKILGTGEFRVIDRRQRETILEEIEFANSDCAEESCQLQIGRLLSASRIVVGSLGTFGDRYIVSVRLLEVETGEAMGTASAKYESSEAIILDCERLAIELLGSGGSGTGRKPSSNKRPISLAKARELDIRLGKLRARVDQQDYERWLAANNFTDYERTTGSDEKVEFLEQYLAESRTRGNSIEVGALYFLFGLLDPSPYGSALTSYSASYIGGLLGWSYQTMGGISVGACFSFARGARAAEFRYVDRLYPSSLFLAGPTLTIGEKVEGLAVVVGLAAGLLMIGDYGFDVYAGRVGLFFRNFFLSDSLILDPTQDSLLHQLEAGYSIFLGKKRTWRADSEKD